MSVRAAFRPFTVTLATLSASLGAFGQDSSIVFTPSACSGVRLAVVDAEPPARLALECDKSGAYAILARDSREPVELERVVEIGWHCSGTTTSIELSASASLVKNLELRARLVPAASSTSAALASAPLSLSSHLPSDEILGASALLVYPMRVRSSPLECSSGSSTSGQISCSNINVHVNDDLRFRFTLPVDTASVSPTTFQVVDTLSGSTPAGTLRVDPLDDRSLYFRPAFTIDAVGNPVFGLASGGVYQIRMPGFAQLDPPPYLMSTTALPNQNRVLTTVIADQGIADYVPGAPHVTLKVDVVTGYDPVSGLPNAFAYGVPAAGATNVWVDSLLTFDFDDVMNPGTLVNPSIGAMPFITVKLDADGDLGTTADQVAQLGSIIALFSVDSHSTRMTFDPFPSWPHSGGGTSPQLVVVDVPSQVKDLAGNALANAGVISFQTEP